MTLPVFFVASEALANASLVVLDGAEARHAAVVRRLRVGETVQLTDGQGAVVTGEIVESRRDSVSVRVSKRAQLIQPAPRIVVVQALPKGERAELAVSLLTEVGVDEVVPWAAERCVVRWSGERAQRGLTKWRNVARESAKQSRRVWWPEVADPASTAEVTQRLTDSDLAVVLHEASHVSLATVTMPASGEVVLVVGPEGGIADSEIEQFSAAGATIAQAGPDVMRTSTAGAVATAVLLSQTSRWST